LIGEISAVGLSAFAEVDEAANAETHTRTEIDDPMVLPLLASGGPLGRQLVLRVLAGRPATTK
jgi:hypothetical protein